MNDTINGNGNYNSNEGGHIHTDSNDTDDGRDHNAYDQK